MGITILMLLAAAFVVFAVVSDRGRTAGRSRPQASGYVRCPTCGAMAPVYGTRWECGTCCDSGSVGNRKIYK